MTEYNGLSEVHKIMDQLDPTTLDYGEALETLANPLSERAKKFCKKYGIPPITAKPGAENGIKIYY